ASWTDGGTRRSLRGGDPALPALVDEVVPHRAVARSRCAVGPGPRRCVRDPRKLGKRRNAVPVVRADLVELRIDHRLEPGPIALDGGAHELRELAPRDRAAERGEVRGQIRLQRTGSLVALLSPRSERALADRPRLRIDAPSG